MADKRKEIQLVDPLYEPTIMYPIEKQPFCEKCRDTYQQSQKEFNPHYQKLIRDKWSGINERELRLKLSSGGMRDNNYKSAKKGRKLSRDIRDIGIETSDECLFSRYVGEYNSFGATTALKELYDLYTELVNTFEMQRLMHLQMTGFLSYKYPSSTHTRFAHVIGTWISGLVALQNVTVVTEEGEERLIEFLVDEDMHREFMAALILHDIGHAPFSHVLEMNPHLEYNHEKITEELIRGEGSYLELEDLLVSSYVDLELGYNEIYGIKSKILKDVSDKIRIKEKFVMVHDVIESMGLNEDIITELFSGEYSKDPAVRVLKGLVHGVIDIDRIDHIYRDLHYNSFKTMGIPLTSLLHGMRIHYGDALGTLDKVVEPWIEISEEITPIVETLLVAREQSNKAIFNNPVNNFYIGVLNAAISDGVIMMPLLKYYIPYLTDEALLHVLTNKDLFRNLSPTEKVGIVTGSSFGHRDYRYSTYKIRDKPEGNIPNEELKDAFKECISEVAMEHDVIWYAFLKDVRSDYGLEAEQYPEPEELWIEKLNEDEWRFEWLKASLLIAIGKKPEEIKNVLSKRDPDDNVINLENKVDVEGLKNRFEEAKDGKDLKRKIEDLIGKKATRIFFKEFLTKTYIGKEPRKENKLEKKLKDYIKGITWEGNDKRSWTFTLFEEKNKSEIDKIEEKIKNGIIWIAEKGSLGSPLFENNGEINEEIKNELKNEKNITFVLLDNTEKDEEKKKNEWANVKRKIEEIASPQPGDKPCILFVIEKIDEGDVQ